ncbi:Esa1p-associated factor [Physocladia obscura]|uniref:Chromatin modification-related protein EAF3 n=1 Tax=Physocladia obscura TaxID=109957 RepID=A0AAD5T872_9FUNG|nr:Esa1p-associated factor [Physocladia obscura]
MADVSSTSAVASAASTNINTNTNTAAGIGGGAPPFSAGDKILCFHGPLLYEAKVLKTDQRGDGQYYLVHYNGWNTKWDEWVPEARTLVHNEANLKRQADLNNLSTKKQRASTGGSSSAAVSGASLSANVTDFSTNRKRARDAGEKEDEYLRRPEIKIPIPESLKIQLVDDWENVTKNQKLVSLPRTPNVAQILKLFKESALKNAVDQQQEDVLEELASGIKIYFDKALGNILLYRFERHQYVELKKKFSDKEMSEVYGAEHLLRLFVQLPQLIAHTNMDQETITVLKDHFVEFLKYMEVNASQLFLQAYEAASPTYGKL